MLAEERFAMILDLLAQKRSATVLELCDALDASESTIRRDLTQLDRQGLLKKVHGGATLVGRTVLADEPPMAAREEQSVEEKRLIARAAAAMITEKDFIFLDAGSTTLALAAALEGPALQAAYVTNGIAHARMLVQKGCRTYLPGGQVPPHHGSHYRAGNAGRFTALQLYQSVYGCQRRKPCGGLYHAGPGGSQHQNRRIAARAGTLVSGG